MYRLRKKEVIEKIHGKADINIGKKGLAPGVLEEIRKRLKKQGVVKIKINRNVRKESFDRKEFAKRLAEAVNAEIADLRGYTIVLVSRGRVMSNVPARSRGSLVRNAPSKATGYEES